MKLTSRQIMCRFLDDESYIKKMDEYSGLFWNDLI